jgi:hypothetical protein
VSWVEIVAVMAVLGTLVVLPLLRRRGREDEDGGSGVIDFATNVALAVFLLVLAYAVVLCRDAISAADSNVATEAETLTELYWTVAPIDEAAPVRDQIRLYTEQSIRFDWPAMTEDRLSPQADQALEGIRASVLRLEPKSDEGKDLRQDALARAAELAHTRELRAIDAETELEPVFVLVMVISGVLVLVLPWTLRRRPGLPAVAADVVRLAMLVVGILFVQNISSPFVGVSTIAPDPLVEAKQQFDRIDQQFPPPVLAG